MKISKNLYAINLYVPTLVFSLVIVFSACTAKQKPAPDSPESNRMNHAFATPVEEAHNMDDWKSKEALKTDILLSFGGQKLLKATLFTETGGPGVRLEVSDDTVAVFDGQQMWVAPSDSAISPFNLKTWAYFLKAPYKLNDPGTKIEPRGTAKMNGQDYNTAKLSFDAGTGDTPDDWYILYRKPETNRLHAMAYIVTAGKTVEEANKEPHAITYEEVTMLDGVPLSTKWNFWAWDAEQGFSDEPIGEATLTNTTFINKENLFAKPDGAMPMKR